MPLRSVSLPATAKSQKRFELLDAHSAVLAVTRGHEDRHHVRPGRQSLALPEEVGIRIQVRHPGAASGVGHPAIRAGCGPVLQRLLRQVGAERGVEAGAHCVVRVLPADDPVGPVEHQPAVLPRHAEDVGESEEREVRRDILGEVHLLRPGHHPVDDRRAVRLDLSLKLANCPGSEGLCEQTAQPRVLGRVHVEHHPLDVSQILRRGRVPDLRATSSGGERRGVAQNRPDIGIPQHEPVPGPCRPAGQLGLLDADQPSLAAQLLEHLEGHADDVGPRVVEESRLLSRQGTARCSSRGRPASRTSGSGRRSA